MLDVVSEFDLPADRVWLNASHQGPLPRRAADAVAQMVQWKLQPHHLNRPQPFTDVPERLRSRLADLVSVPASEITLANSSSYGLHLVANGLELGEGDEVVVAANDFPADILPWLRLRRFGVKVTQVQPSNLVPSADEIRAAITARTRVVCLAWVHSFSGLVIDLDAIGNVCRSVDALLVVNASQGIGAIPMTPRRLPVDVVTSVGFKWLCGPYGTGFCWLGERALDRIQPTKLYWLNAFNADDLARPELDLENITPAVTGRHDVFGTANFFNFAALAESVELVRVTGVDRIHSHNLALAGRLVDSVDQSRFEIQDRGNAARLSSIVFVRPIDRALEDVAHRLESRAIDVARRRGMIRIAPHFYNTESDIDQAVDVLNAR
jgi:selenocysteine lyase/cysteine desulfurase